MEAARRWKLFDVAWGLWVGEEEEVQRREDEWKPAPSIRLIQHVRCRCLGCPHLLASKGLAGDVALK